MKMLIVICAWLLVVSCSNHRCVVIYDMAEQRREIRKSADLTADEKGWLDDALDDLEEIVALAAKRADARFVNKDGESVIDLYLDQISGMDE